MILFIFQDASVLNYASISSASVYKVFISENRERKYFIEIARETKPLFWFLSTFLVLDQFVASAGTFFASGP